MLPFAILALSLSLASATLATHAVSVAKCVRTCEAENACHTSLESLSCEASCQAVCKCAAISRRMLNKPKHCMTAMLEEHHKRLSLFRMGHPRMSKVVLKDDQAKSDSDFAAYVPLEDFWPHGHDEKSQESEEHSKPVMLNSHAELSLLRRNAMPWSAEQRSRGKGGHRHHHRHHHSTAFLEQNKNSTKTEKQSNVEKAAIPSKGAAITKVPANTTKSSKIQSFMKEWPSTPILPVNTNTSNSSKVVAEPKPEAAKEPSKANATSKVAAEAETARSSNATTPAKVVAASNSSKTAAGVKTKEPAKRK